MRRLLVFPLALLFLVAACEDSGPSPMAGPGDLAGPLFDLQVEGDHFFFLPPLASNPSTTGTPDMERSPRVVVCPVNGTECPADEARTFDADAAGDHYRVNWSPDHSGAKIGETWRIEVWLGDLRLGYLVVSFARSARAGEALPGVVLVGTNRDVPIRFRIEEGAVQAALEGDCEVGGVIVDCDVQQSNPDGTASATVRDEDGNVAGIINILSSFIDGPFFLVLKHVANLEEDPDFPGDPIPFFLQVSLFDEDGNLIDEFHPDFLAEVVVCQDPDLEDDLLHQFLKIFQVLSDGTTIIHETNVGDPRCAGFVEPGAQSGSASLSLPQRVKRDLATAASGFFRTQPLRALHGGLNTTTNRFSEFGAVLDLDEAPFEYGEVDFEWESSEGSGTGPGPFSAGTQADFAQLCPNLSIEDGTGGDDVWPVGGTGEGEESDLTLLKSFFVPSGTTHLRVWAGIDNDIKVILNDEDITHTFVPSSPAPPLVNPSSFGGLVDGFLEHEGCAWDDAVSFLGEAVEGINTLEVIARDRGSIGYINLRVDVETLIP